MVCQKCKKSDAKLTLSRMVSGEMVQESLCPECARGLEKPEILTLFSEEGLLHHLMDVMEDSALKIEHVVTLRCPKCGLTFAGYKKMRKLGCNLCYTTFENKLLEWIKRYHGSAVHVGLKPHQSETTEYLTYRLHLEQLNQAVVLEDYEEAARLRDLIRSEKGRLYGE